MDESAMDGRLARCSQLTLLGRFELVVGSELVSLPRGAQRLLAFLGVRNGLPVNRSAAAEQLWPESRRQRAAANLRQALWQVRRSTEHPVVEAATEHLRLSPLVAVDLSRALDSAHRADPGADEWLAGLLGRDLLPYWSEEWLVAERQRWEQVRLHTLEAIARRLLSAGSHLAALEAALTAIAIDPVRESAHCTVIAVHLAQGNTGSALRHYQHYRGLLHRELGVLPSPRMTKMVPAPHATL
ncbi:AfsR/SARP family transcriptional regulator [Amycolatopsis magusensis]|uniref:AfsR/SARP family transcriptional regulator n=1 Tax=Amycolatopsis magusensis TaxID=882444 RepID=UPI0037B4EFEF